MSKRHYWQVTHIYSFKLYKLCDINIYSKANSAEAPLRVVQRCGVHKFSTNI